MWLRCSYSSSYGGHHHHTVVATAVASCLVYRQPQERPSKRRTNFNFNHVDSSPGMLSDGEQRCYFFSVYYLTGLQLQYVVALLLYG